MGKLDASSGEFQLIEALRRRAGPAASPWRLAIGDDAALLRPRPKYEIVVTTDALVEDVHFRWRTADPRALGEKALAASLSDLGAMGATPLGCLLSLGLPGRDARLEPFASGLLAAARQSRCPLVGGDTVRSPLWLISLVALGEVPQGRALLRSGARPGDRVLVTGDLGASGLGLALLERGATDLPGAAAFVRRHRRPRPPWRAGAKLVRSGHATAAIDVSDGLAQDLGHILRESGVGADLDLDRLPLARGLRPLCRRLDLDPGTLALSAGEDYELLFCVGARAPEASVFTRRLGCRVREIGRIRRGRGLAFFRAGERVTAPNRGFEHFKSP